MVVLEESFMVDGEMFEVEDELATPPNALIRSAASGSLIFADGLKFEASARLSWVEFPDGAISSVPSLSRRHLPREQTPPRPFVWTMARVALAT